MDNPKIYNDGIGEAIAQYKTKFPKQSVGDVKIIAKVQNQDPPPTKL